MGFPLMVDEEERLSALEELDILDTPAETSFDNLTALAAHFFQVPTVLITFLDRERQWFKSYHGFNLCETSRELSFCAHAIASQEVMVIPDATLDPRFASNSLVVRNPHIRFYAGAPLRIAGGPFVGTLCLIDSLPRSFSEEEQAALRRMASLVVDELELRLSRTRLQTREKYWRSLIAGSSDIITVLGPSGHIQYQSPAVASVLGMEPDEFVARPLSDFVHPDDQKAASAILRSIGDEVRDERTFECRLRHRDGSWRDVEVIAKNCLGDESVKGLLLTARDITERKQMQERLRLLESVVVNTNDTVIVTEAEPLDEPGPRILYVNEAFTAMTGYSADEVVGRSPRFLQGPETQRPPLDELREALENQHHTKVQVINYRKDGTSFWAEMSISPVKDNDGVTTHWVSVQRDITHNKQAEEALRLANEEARRTNEALRRSGKQLRLALEAGHMGTWERDYASDKSYLSAQTKALYGFGPDEFNGTLESIFERVHPEDREQLEQRLRAKRPTHGFVEEFRVIWPDGSLHWLESRGQTVRDEEGQAKGTVGVVLDVTERKLDLEGAQLETLKRLALAAEYRDDDTGLHTQRVGRLSRALAEALGLPQPVVQLIGETSPLHDVGKIGVSDSILLKPGKLSPEEFAVIKRHTHIGAGILSGSSSPWLKMAEEIALTHHERWDGMGYSGLKGEEIPLVGCIVCVADVFDALTHERPYKKAWPLEEAVAEIVAQSGQQFCPRVVEAFLTLNHEDYL